MNYRLKICALYLALLCLSACASVSIQSQMAPDVHLTKNSALFLSKETKPSIEHQKYISALNKHSLNMALCSAHKIASRVRDRCGVL